MGMDEVLAKSETHDPSVDVANAELDQARAALDGSLAVRRPQVTAFARTGLGDTGLTTSAIENQFGLRASQRIFDFGASKLQRAAERENVAARTSLREEARLSAGLDAGLNVLAYLQATDQLAITAEREAFFDRELEVLNVLLLEGNATRADIAEAGAELASAQAAREELLSQRDKAAARVTLATSDARPPCRIDLDMAGLAEVIGIGADEAAAKLQQGLAANPQLEGLRRTASSLEAQSELSKRSRLPAIDLVAIGSYTFNDIDETFAFRDRVGIEVSVPILTGSALDASARGAAALASKARSQVRSAQRQLEEDIYDLVRSRIALSAQLFRLNEVERRRLDRFDSAIAEHAARMLTLPDLIEIRLDLEEARLNVVSAQYQLEAQQLRLAVLTGTLTSD